jgi:hypothetical protein
MRVLALAPVHGSPPVSVCGSPRRCSPTCRPICLRPMSIRLNSRQIYAARSVPPWRPPSRVPQWRSPPCLRCRDGESSRDGRAATHYCMEGAAATGWPGGEARSGCDVEEGAAVFVWDFRGAAYSSKEGTPIIHA